MPSIWPFSRSRVRDTRKCSHSKAGVVLFVDEDRQQSAALTWITTTRQWLCADCYAIVVIDIYQHGLTQLGSDQLLITSTIHLGP